MKKIFATATIPLAALTLGAIPVSASHYGYEYNYAKRVTEEAGYTRCLGTTGAHVCYQEVGDKWWVRDTERDGRSAVVDWSNGTSRDHQRWGSCRNKDGAETRRLCNKDYPEGSYLKFRACTYNASSGTWGISDFGRYRNSLRCGSWDYMPGGA